MSLFLGLRLSIIGIALLTASLNCADEDDFDSVMTRQGQAKDLSKCPTACSGTDASACKCDAFANDTNVEVTYSCVDGKCVTCAKLRKQCKFGSTTLKSCDTSTPSKPGVLNVSCRQANSRLKNISACLSPCDARINFKPCYVNKRAFYDRYDTHYKSCKVAGAPAGTWSECLETGTANVPRNCGSTGVSCTRNLTAAPVDTCCLMFACIDGKCVPECAQNAKRCKFNSYKGTCARFPSIEATFMNCTLKGVTYGAPGRYKQCKGSKPNTFIQCFSKFKDPAECGATDAPCDLLQTYTTCCTNFYYNPESKCAPECPKGPSKDCKIRESGAVCTAEGRYIECKAPNSETKLFAKYLRCGTMTAPNTFIECVDEFSEPPHDESVERRVRPAA